MGVQYKAIQWNKGKKVYDRILWVSILASLILFALFEFIFHSTIPIETIIIRATAFTAILLLHVILVIGPLARIDDRFIPLLYNRRHMGVSMFLLALVHGIFCIVQFHALGNKNPIVSLFVSNQNYDAISEFPFQVLGFFALLVFFLMAVTSHDFWLKNLSPKIWKGLHMCVYLAYGLVILHVALGTLQYESNLLYWVILSIGFISISSLHLFTGIREFRMLMAQKKELGEFGFFNVGRLSDIEESCGKSVFINGENIAIFKYNGKVSAVHNICKHQMGPLGEGKVIDGCITCPWHGYQYLPENGQSPAPFNERLKTYRVRILKNEVWVNPNPFEEGTFVEAAEIEK